jgi:tRNA(Ile2) C34 agmatinyltransferase TiaS
MIYIGLDDTDTKESRGTGRLAREIAEALSAHSGIFGVTRHQLFVHPSIPYTSHNSCAVIHAEANPTAVNELYTITREMMLDDFIVGSDPGLAVAHENQVTSALVSFGLDAKNTIVTRKRADEVANKAGIRFESLGGTGDGVIGAVAGIGLASLRNDGRFLLKGRNRELAAGLRPVKEILSAGIDEVQTLQGISIKEGKVEILKNATPSFVRGKAILFVEEKGERMVALKRD